MPSVLMQPQGLRPGLSAHTFAPLPPLLYRWITDHKSSQSVNWTCIFHQNLIVIQSKIYSKSAVITHLPFPQLDKVGVRT